MVSVDWLLRIDASCRDRQRTRRCTGAAGNASSQVKVDHGRPAILAFCALSVGRIRCDRVSHSSQPLLVLVFGGAKVEDSQTTQIPGAVPLTIGAAAKIDGGVQSAPITVDDRKITIVRIGQGTFTLDEESRLTATFNSGVSHCTETKYWIHAAVFDRRGQLLGTASHEISVSNIRLPVSPTIIHELELDFGISTRFGDASQLVVTIGER